MEDFLKGLSQPEYLHVVLNHLPIIGLMSGLLVLVIAFLQKSPATAFAAYLLIFLASLSVYPVAELGEKAVDRLEGIVDADGRRWMNEHGSRAERVEWVYYLTAGFSLAGLVGGHWKPEVLRWCILPTLLAGSLALGGGIWVAQAGGKIIHREFRYTPLESEGSEN